MSNFVKIYRKIRNLKGGGIPLSSEQKRPRINRRVMFLAAAVIIIAVLIFVLVARNRKRQEEKKLVSQGVSYLTELEQRDVKPIQEDIKKVHSTIGLELADSDENAVWASFTDAVILGDSRAVGFYYHEFMPEERVMAKGGGMITDVSEYTDQLKTLNPAQIFLCYGLNDIGIGTWPEAEDYAEEYKAQVQLLHERLPDSEVFVNSVLPAFGAGLEADPDYPRVGEYNDALKAMCEEEGYHYIDNTQMAEDHKDLYQEDGLHVETEFYKYWAANMLAEVKE